MEDRFAVLFEPVKIGPVLVPNRFYQVPHCNGMGYRMPRALTAMRGIKAEGGWGVVCTEEIEIHHTSDLAPNIIAQSVFSGHLAAREFGERQTDKTPFRVEYVWTEELDLSQRRQ